MARGEEPLLARRPSSEHGSVTEEDALLTGQPSQAYQTKPRWGKWREIGLFVWALLVTAAVIVLAVIYQHETSTHSDKSRPHDGSRPTGKRNLVFMVSDGMGPTSLSLTRSFRQYVGGLPYDDALVLDGHLIGQSRTRSSNSLVTDSAAGATAFSCGMKSYNGAISVLPDHTPCGSVMEAAKRAGYTTGLVVTTRITDATPACFASHVLRRDMEDMIADQLIGNGPLGRSVDLMFGGGRCHFLPNTTQGGCRADGADLIDQAQKDGWDYISTREDFDGLTNMGSAVRLPLLGLFAPRDIPFEIDRRHVNYQYPSLEEMAKAALKALSDATKDSDKGFFIMIEGSRIDHAGHGNDPAAQVHEVLAYDRTVQAVLEFLDQDETEGLMVSTSDHETGGLAAARRKFDSHLGNNPNPAPPLPLFYLAHDDDDYVITHTISELHSSYPQYLWYPEVLANASHSAEFAAAEYIRYLADATASGSSSSSDGKTDKEKERFFLTKLVEKALGIHDVSSAELDTLAQDPAYSPYTFADMISRRSQTGWSTHGHSAVDVNIYASDPRKASRLVGNRENTDVGAFLRWWLDLDAEVDAVTSELRHKMRIAGADGEAALPSTADAADAVDVADAYHGDYDLHFGRGRGR